MEVSAVKLRNSYQIYYIDAENIFIKQNSLCVVEIEHGIDIGNVVKIRNFQNDPANPITGKVIRKATDDDLSRISELESIEEKAFGVCREKSKAKNLEMKLVSVKCLFDKTKLIFYFVSDNRIDFRELVRELAAVFRTRIEMRQIGVRDEAKIVGGYGPCGKSMCCLYQREEFEPVSIKMAKEQNLNLNSMKISGMCGRLLCCLGFEYNVYKELNEKMPEVDSVITAGDKQYRVVSVNTLKEAIVIKDGDRFVEIGTEDLILKDEKYSIKDELIEELFKADDESDK
jgi:cell fate regulator YaaT (PSP1 superfamily)